MKTKKLYTIGMALGLLAAGHLTNAQTPGGVPIAAWYRDYGVF